MATFQSGNRPLCLYPGTSLPPLLSRHCPALLVLRLVFTDALVYDRKTGFGTPSFSLPINIACVLELDKMEVVDMVRKSWNTLEGLVREWAESLRALPQAKNQSEAA